MPLNELAMASKSSRHHSRQMSHLNRVLKDVLTVACAEMQAAEDSDNARIQIEDSRFISGLGALFFYNLVYFFLRFFNLLLDFGRLDASVNDQIFHRHSCHLPSDRIK